MLPATACASKQIQGEGTSQRCAHINKKHHTFSLFRSGSARYKFRSTLLFVISSNWALFHFLRVDRFIPWHLRFRPKHMTIKLVYIISEPTTLFVNLNWKMRITYRVKSIFAIIPKIRNMRIPIC